VVCGVRRGVQLSGVEWHLLFSWCACFFIVVFVFVFFLFVFLFVVVYEKKFGVQIFFLWFMCTQDPVVRLFLCQFLVWWSFFPIISLRNSSVFLFYARLSVLEWICCWIKLKERKKREKKKFWFEVIPENKSQIILKTSGLCCCCCFLHQLGCFR